MQLWSHIGDLFASSTGGTRTYTKNWGGWQINAWGTRALTDRVFDVGDLIDRNLNSERCLNLLDEKWFFSVLGNHEKLILEINLSKLYQSELWYQNEGKWWQYLDNELKNKYFNLANKLPLSISIETNFDNIGIVHADHPFHSRPPT